MQEVLKDKRKASGYTQAALAVKVGVSQSYICQLENGYEKNPTKDVLEALARALGITVGTLMGEGGRVEDNGRDHAGVRNQKESND